MEDSTQGWTQLGPFFPKSGHFFQFSKKGRGDPPPTYPLVACLYSDFKKFFRHNDNGTELFSLTADNVPKLTQNISITVICTKLLEVA